MAGDLLKQYKRKFTGGALSVTWTYLRDSMSNLSQTNPVATHREGYTHLRDPRFQLDAFQVTSGFSISLGVHYVIRRFTGGLFTPLLTVMFVHLITITFFFECSIALQGCFTRRRCVWGSTQNDLVALGPGTGVLTTCSRWRNLTLSQSSLQNSMRQLKGFAPPHLWWKCSSFRKGFEIFSAVLPWRIP